MRDGAVSNAALFAANRAKKISANVEARVFSIEEQFTALGTRVNDLENLANNGFTGSVSVVISVDFTAQSVVTKTFAFLKGTLTGVS